MIHVFSDFDSQSCADEADAFNENYFRYLTEDEHVDVEDAYRIVYGN